MMKRDFLKGLGLTDAQVDSIMEENGKDVNHAKADYETVKTERDTLKNSLTDRDKQLTELKKNHADNEALQKQLTEAQEANKAAAKEFEDKNAALRKEFAVESALRDVGALNVKAAKALLDLEKIQESKDGTYAGLKEQIEAAKTADDSKFMFKTETTEPARIDGTKPGQGMTESEAGAMQAQINAAMANI